MEGSVALAGFGRRPVLMLVVAAVILSLTVAAYAVPPRQSEAVRSVAAHPSPSTSPLGCARREPPHRFGIRVDNECVGYSDGPELLFGTGTALPEAQRRVFRYNEEVERLPLDRYQRVRLIVLTGLSGSDDGHPAERETLEGLAVAQAEALGERDRPTRPLLQVVMANAGSGGRHVDALLPELARLAQDDPTVLGVLVAMDSRTATRRAMLALRDNGLLVLTAGAVADRLRDGMTRYLQFDPPTRERAKLVRAYAGAIGRPRIVTVYEPSRSEDLAVEELRRALDAEFESYAEVPWDGSADVNALCGAGIALYGGGATGFGGFLRALHRTCGRRSPILLGVGDSVRYLLGDPRRTGRVDAPADYPFVFSGNGIGAGACRPRTDPHRLFLAVAARVLGKCRDPEDPTPLGILTVPTYDLVRVVLSAAAELNGAALTANAVHARVLESGRRRAFEGAAGPVRFGADGVVTTGGQSLMCARDVRAAYTPGNVPWEVARTGPGGVPRVRGGRCAG
ncbi:hypothetical protein [Virgisporangium aliadipatigenens]|uniref:hypothetical protein n=1 Tax=Virgisporangium aliadipatigenens TaxID=741659 RepID=UPI001943307B|nr:hypothetical protein [Virgisporangium aliadipatigenens]